MKVRRRGGKKGAKPSEAPDVVSRHMNFKNAQSAAEIVLQPKGEGGSAMRVEVRRGGRARKGEGKAKQHKSVKARLSRKGRKGTPVHEIPQRGKGKKQRAWQRGVLNEASARCAGDAQMPQRRVSGRMTISHGP